ncbi:hypothetical protein POM88_053305 [Heracleum sosnowskyi]|uniref:Serine-threonine/tyrosine-protein kinase catalytic domain-containing protein n=1 Tax=Heracleum sosnowskyi TaxID=360622 RepID=A0AAD8LX47_9APIA|nr:hypothetical protein POM88_053305 [Heracleum sosnowskyi]
MAILLVLRMMLVLLFVQESSAELNGYEKAVYLIIVVYIEVPLLVYEFIPNGTLFHYIHHRNEDFPLTWNVRVSVASEVAGALSYLHTAGPTHPICPTCNCIGLSVYTF